MPERAIIDRILHAGVQAPSGDNTQPWSFRIEEGSIAIHAHPELDHPVLNVEGRGTWLATGALIENIVIAAQHEGYEAAVRLFERDGETARISFAPAREKGHRLHSAIEKRHTHRGAYAASLSPEELAALRVHAEEECRIELIDEPHDISAIAQAAVAMEESALRTKKLHYHFFRSILWNSSDNAAGKTGLYIRTTELPPPVQALFRLIRHWPIMRVFSLLGLPRLAAAQNAAVYASSGAMAAIILKRTEPRDFIAAGRCMQRVWLAATEAGLAAQPLAGLIYLEEYVRRTDDAEFDEAMRQRIYTARGIMRAASREGSDTMAMMLRIGVPKSGATARSKRRKPTII